MAYEVSWLASSRFTRAITRPWPQVGRSPATFPFRDSSSSFSFRCYTDMPGFCKAATREEIAAHGYVLAPGRYVGAADVEEDDTPFPERFAALQARLEEQFAESERLTEAIRERLKGLHVDG